MTAANRRFVDPDLIAQYDELNVCNFGVDSTGRIDETAILTALHATGKPIYYPNGTYLFNGETLDLSGGVRFESLDGVCIRNRISDVNIINFDDRGNLIGLMQNHLEYDSHSLGKKAGSLVSPPLSTSKRETDVDVIAYWYNDFGLTCHHTLNYGWTGWHYWTWNHHNCTETPLMHMGDRVSDPYDPSRHPLLGFYYGDDPTVLDWQSYWLYEHGVNVVCLLGSGQPDWENPNCNDHWLYQLFHHTPNFKKLQFTIAGPIAFIEDKAQAPAAAQKLRKQYADIIDTLYAPFDNVYCIREDDKRFPIISFFGENHLLSVFDTDGGIMNTANFYAELAKKMRKIGYDGLAAFSVFPDPRFDTPEMNEWLEKHHVRRFRSSYTPWHIGEGLIQNGTYRRLVDSYDPPSDPHTILGVGNSVNTHTPHESCWVCPGNTPELFEEFLQKAVDHLDNNPNMKRIVTCYNISEWAEGGPGLQPNVQDGFGYLDAIEKVVVR